MTQDNKSSKLQAELKALHGTDPLLDHLMAKGPVTRESYLAFEYPDGVPDPMTGEDEASLPAPLRLNTASETGPAKSALPSAPVRANYESQDDFEEAMGYWQGHVGRILGMVARAQPSKDSPPTSK